MSEFTEIPRLLREEARKTWQHVESNVVVYATQNPVCEPPCWPRLRERYDNLDVWMEVLLDIDVGGDACKYVAILERASVPLDAGIEGIGRLDDGCWEVEQSMFIDDVKLMQHPEKFSLRGLPSVVRLKRLDDLDRAIGKVSNLPVSERFSPVNREFGAVERLTRLSAFSNPDDRELPRQMIESVPEAGDGFTGVHPGRERHGLALLDVVDVERLIRIELSDHAVWSRGYEGVQPMLKRLKVFVRPDDLQPWPIQWMPGVDVLRHERESR